MKPPIGADMIEMVDGRIFWSIDNWQTVYVISAAGRCRQVPPTKVDLVRFLAVSQSSWSGNAG